MKFPQIWKLSDLWRVTSRRKLCERSAKCDSRGTPRKFPDDVCHEPCRAECDTPPTEGDPTAGPCPKRPTCHPHSDPRKLMFWRTLSLFVALPLVVITSMITYRRQQEEARRPRESFLDLPHMCRRTKQFPWGDGNHTLFHNPVKNPVPPYGYEVEDPNAIYAKKAAN